MSTAAEKRVIRLMTTDGGSFQVEEAVAMMSQTIKHIIQDDRDDHAITLPSDFTSEILVKVIEYCKKHHESKVDDCDGLKNWDADFVKVDQDTLFDLIMAAYYLNIRELLDLTYRTGADVMKGKTPEQINRQSFNVKNDYNSPKDEEKEEVRRENQWASFE